ncbi:hypothetical protein AVL50_15885 [Flammeovirga sp. SJP92]|nr:hypothetical protein AVL50_15885 [Flammeovirga sp. SJP92]
MLFLGWNTVNANSNFSTKSIKLTSENIALNKSASSSSGDANAAVDGNTGSRWESAHEDNQWISVDLGQRYDITQVVLNWEGAFGKTYDIEVSDDGQSWSIAFSQTDGAGGIEDLPITASGRFVRMNGFTRATSYGFSLWELEVYGTLSEVQGPTISSINYIDGYTHDNPLNYTEGEGLTLQDASRNNYDFLGWYLEDNYSTQVTVITEETTGDITLYGKWTLSEGVPINLALNQPATASSGDGNAAVDGDLGSRWESSHEDNQWIYVDLGQRYDITQVVLNWEGAYGDTYDIEVSDDAQNWTVTFSQTEGVGGIEEITLTGTGRFVRMNGFTRATGYGFSLYEFEVYGTLSDEQGPTVSNIRFIDGFAHDNPSSYTEGTELTLSDATRQNYDFNGWYLEDTYTTQVTVITEETTGDLTLYGKWTLSEGVPVNVALGKSTASSSGEGDLAVDGDLETRWESALGDTEWLYIDLEKTYDITSVVLNWEGAFGKIYDIEISNDAQNWTVIHHETDGQVGVNLHEVIGSGRFVRMKGIERGTGFGYSFWEFEVYGEESENQGPAVYTITYTDAYIHSNPSTYVEGSTVTLLDAVRLDYLFKGWFLDAELTNQIIEITATSTEHLTLYAKWEIDPNAPVLISLNKPSISGAGDASFGNDGDYESIMESNLEDTSTDWWYVDLQGNYDIERVAIYWEGAYASNYEIQVSNNGELWTTIHHQTEPVVENNGQLKLEHIFNVHGTGKYVRILGNERATPHGFKFYEVNVYGEESTAEVPDSYSITYNDGYFHNNPSLYEEGSTLTFEDPLRLDYIFEGWYTDDAYTTAITEITPSTKGELTLFAKWTATGKTSTNVALEKKTQTSSGNGEGAVDGDMDTRWESNGTDEEWISIDLVKRYDIGQINLMWEGAFGKEYNLEVSEDGEAWTVIHSEKNGKVGLVNHPVAGAGRFVKVKGIKRGTGYGYSLFEIEVMGTLSIDQGPEVYTVSYVDAFTNENPNSYTEGKGFVLKDPSRMDYLFKGWFLDSEFTSPITEITATMSGELTLYAKWEKDPSAPGLLSLDKPSYAGAGEASRGNDGDYSSLFESNVADNTTDWWYVDLLGYYDIERIIIQWEGAFAEEYQIQVSSDLETWSTIHTQVGHVIENDLKHQLTLQGTARFVRVQGVKRFIEDWGFKFYQFEVYGKKAEGNFPGIFEINYVDGFEHTNPLRYDGGDEFVLTDAIREGYVFGGWFTDVEFSNQITSITASSTGDMKIYGKWLRINTINYVEGFEHSNPATVIDGDVVALQSAVREGYIFDGWFLDEGFENRIEEITITNSEDITLYAKWSIVLSNGIYEKVSITFFPNPVINTLKVDGTISQLMIFTIEGKLLKEYRVMQKEFNLSDLQAGFYLIRYKANGQFYSAKIQKR